MHDPYILSKLGQDRVRVPASCAMNLPHSMMGAWLLLEEESV
jgi:hypothetical protein